MKNLGVKSTALQSLLFAALAVLVFSLTSSPGLAGEPHQERFAKTLVSLRDAIDGAVIAKVMPGTALGVMAKKGDWLEVTVEGWSPAGGERYLFKEIGQRIRLAKMTEQGLAKRKVIGEKKDDYENTWQKARLTGWVEAARTSPDIDGVWKAASALFHKRCTRCHALHRPTEFTANQWPSILKIMTVRAGLSADRKALVTQYLQTHAKGQQAAAAEEAPAPSGTATVTGDAKLAAEGAALFRSRNCFGCHGADARTPALPSYPKLAGQNADYLFKQMKDFKSGARANDEDRVMKENMADIPEEEMRAIAYWLSTQ